MKKIIINEVWNAEGKSVEIGRIDAILLPSGHINQKETADKVKRWIECHRKDLKPVMTISEHGYSAREK